VHLSRLGNCFSSCRLIIWYVQYRSATKQYNNTLAETASSDTRPSIGTWYLRDLAAVAGKATINVQSCLHRPRVEVSCMYRDMPSVTIVTPRCTANCLRDDRVLLSAPVLSTLQHSIQLIAVATQPCIPRQRRSGRR